MNLHTRLGKLAGGGGGGDRRTPVGNHRILGGLMPCNGIPDEILTDHPDRLRAAIVESANPVHSLADSPRWREAFAALEFSVVIDVAMTETGALRRLRPAGELAVREGGGDVLHPRVPRELLPSASAAARPAPRDADRSRDPPSTLSRARRLLRRRPGAAPRRGRRGARRLRRGVLHRARRASGPRQVPADGAVRDARPGPARGHGDRRSDLGTGPDLRAPKKPESAARAGYESGNALFRAIVDSPSGIAFSSDPYERHLGPDAPRRPARSTSSSTNSSTSSALCETRTRGCPTTGSRSSSPPANVARRRPTPPCAIPSGAASTRRPDCDSAPRTPRSSVSRTAPRSAS